MAKVVIFFNNYDNTVINMMSSYIPFDIVQCIAKYNPEIPYFLLKTDIICRRSYELDLTDFETMMEAKQEVFQSWHGLEMEPEFSIDRILDEMRNIIELRKVQITQLDRKCITILKKWYSILLNNDMIYPTICKEYSIYVLSTAV